LTNRDQIKVLARGATAPIDAIATIDAIDMAVAAGLPRRHGFGIPSFTAVDGGAR
jgi:hypothetical protein